jgi:beta-glucosidase
MIDPKLRGVFKSGFLWGASVAAHQVEGGNNNQWTAWEHETAARQAATAKHRLSWLPVWQSVKKDAANPNNYISGRGIDHFNRYETDFAIAKKLGLNSMRSGIEWSRINPEEGVYDQKAIAHYQKYFKAMRKAGLEPFVNLFHWTMPQWFADKGGFTKVANLVYWRDYIHTLLEHFEFSDINYILLINEANTYSVMGYAGTEFPPGEKNLLKSWWVYRNLALAHRQAYKIIKSMHPNIQIGSAHQCNSVVGHGLVGKFMAKAQLWFWNYSWLDSARHHDFIGINYYFTDHRKGFSLAPNANPSEPLNDLGWYMNPSGIEKVFRGIAKRYPGVPMIVTENGVADMHDELREWWIAETIDVMSKVVKDGIPLIGYLHWSLLDNFEWQYGWFPKFGLIAVDRNTMQRSVKKSARAWSTWLTH